MSKSGVTKKGVPYAQIPWEAIYDTTLSPHTFRVYAYLMKRADHESRTWPSIRTIADELKMSTATITKAVTELGKSGWLEIEKKQVDKHKQQNLYVVLGSRTVSFSDTVSDPVDERVSDDVEAEPCHLVKLSVSRDATEPCHEVLPKEHHGLTPEEHHEESADASQLAVIDDNKPVSTVKQAHDVMAYALVDAMGWKRKEVTEVQWGRVHEAAKQLTKVDADPDDATRRASVYRINMSGATLSPLALAANWADCAEPRAPIPRREIEQAAIRQRTRDAMARLE